MNGLDDGVPLRCGGGGKPGAAEAGLQLKHCTERLADYTDRVFQALHQM
jgi:hypothetical protein